MKRLTGFELYKVWGKRSFLGVLAALLLVNLFLLWYTERPEMGGFPSSAYRLLQEDLRGKTERQKQEFIQAAYERATAFSLIDTVKVLEIRNDSFAQLEIDSLKQEHPGLYEAYIGVYTETFSPRYTANLEQETAFLGKVWEEIQQVSAYPAYLDDIQNKADNLSGISIFAPAEHGGFSSRNIQKTAADYQAMRGISICYDGSQGFLSATGFFVTDLLALLMLFVLSCILIFDEKQKNLFSLVRVTPRGRLPTISAKLFTLGISSACVVLLLFGGNLLYCAVTMGLGDLSRSLQSVGSFLGSTLRMSVGQYLLLFLFTKWLACWIAGSLILLVSVLSRHPAVALLSAAALFAVSFGMLAWIPSQSDWNLLKYLNPAAVLRTNELYRQYLNFNLFGRPVNLIPAVFWFLLAAGALLIAGVLFAFVYKRQVRANRISLRRTPLSFLRPRQRGTSVFFQEGYKLLLLNKAALFLLLFAVLTALALPTSPDYLPSDELVYRQYMTALSGKMSPEKQQFLDQESAALEDAAEKVQAISLRLENGEISQSQADLLTRPYNAVLARQQIFDRVLQQVAYSSEHPDASILYDTGYRKLFAASGNALSLLPLMVFSVLCFASVFAMEYKNNAARLICVTPLGRKKTAAAKLLLSILLAIPLCLLSVLPELARVCLTYGLPGLSYSVQSLPLYANLPSWLPVWGFLLLHYGFQLLGCVSVTLVVCALSLRLKNSIYAIMVSFLLLGVPILLNAMGLGFATYFSLLPLFQAGYYWSANGNLPLFFGYLLAVGAAAIFCILYSYRRFGRPAPVQRKRASAAS